MTSVVNMIIIMNVVLHMRVFNNFSDVSPPLVDGVFVVVFGCSDLPLLERER